MGFRDFVEQSVAAVAALREGRVPPDGALNVTDATAADVRAVAANVGRLRSLGVFEGDVKEEDGGPAPADFAALLLALGRPESTVEKLDYRCDTNEEVVGALVAALEANSASAARPLRSVRLACRYSGGTDMTALGEALGRHTTLENLYMESFSPEQTAAFTPGVLQSRSLQHLCLSRSMYEPDWPRTVAAALEQGAAPSLQSVLFSSDIDMGNAAVPLLRAAAGRSGLCYDLGSVERRLSKIEGASRWCPPRGVSEWGKWFATAHQERCAVEEALQGCLPDVLSHLVATFLARRSGEP
jgi:hypothetical protein